MSKQSKAEEFVVLWMYAKRNNKSTDWLAEKIGTTRQGIEQRAYRYRAWGVKLPRLKYQVTNPYDIDKLNRLIGS